MIGITYVVMARVNEYYSSASVLGTFNTYDQAFELVEKLFTGLKPVELNPHKFFDPYFLPHDEDLPKYTGFNGTYLYIDEDNRSSIVNASVGIIEYMTK